MTNPILALLLMALLSCSVGAFAQSTITVHSTSTPSSTSTSRLESTTDPQTQGKTASGLLKRDCYVATNRFSVRRDQQAKFEKRWATRKSKLAVLDGFRYFHLMRRVDGDSGAYVGGESNEDAFENYVSFTIWNKKSDFSAWRKGEAFKEAHGGTSISAFLNTMMSSAMVLRGAPRPAFYDGLYYSQKIETEKDVVDGWRNVDADGIKTLPAECFVEFTKFFVAPERAQGFEEGYQKTQEANDSLMVQSLMRRDGQAKGHGVAEMDTATEPTYVGVKIFPSRDVYQPTESFDDSVRTERSYYEGTLMMSKE